MKIYFSALRCIVTLKLTYFEADSFQKVYMVKSWCHFFITLACVLHHVALSKVLKLSVSSHSLAASGRLCFVHLNNIYISGIFMPKWTKVLIQFLNVCGEKESHSFKRKKQKIIHLVWHSLHICYAIHAPWLGIPGWRLHCTQGLGTLSLCLYPVLLKAVQSPFYDSLFIHFSLAWAC